MRRFDRVFTLTGRDGGSPRLGVGFRHYGKLHRARPSVEIDPERVRTLASQGFNKRQIAGILRKELPSLAIGTIQFHLSQKLSLMQAYDQGIQQ